MRSNSVVLNLKKKEITTRLKVSNADEHFFYKQFPVKLNYFNSNSLIL